MKNVKLSLLQLVSAVAAAFVLFFSVSPTVVAAATYESVSFGSQEIVPFNTQTRTVTIFSNNFPNTTYSYHRNNWSGTLHRTSWIRLDVGYLATFTGTVRHLCTPGGACAFNRPIVVEALVEEE